MQEYFLLNVKRALESDSQFEITVSEGGAKEQQLDAIDERFAFHLALLKFPALRATMLEFLRRFKDTPWWAARVWSRVTDKDSLLEFIKLNPSEAIPEILSQAAANPAILSELLPHFSPVDIKRGLLNCLKATEVTHQALVPLIHEHAADCLPPLLRKALGHLPTTVCRSEHAPALVRLVENHGILLLNPILAELNESKTPERPLQALRTLCALRGAEVIEQVRQTERAELIWMLILEQQSLESIPTERVKRSLLDLLKQGNQQLTAAVLDKALSHEKLKADAKQAFTAFVQKLESRSLLASLLGTYPQLFESFLQLEPQACMLKLLPHLDATQAEKIRGVILTSPHSILEDLIELAATAEEILPLYLPLFEGLRDYLIPRLLSKLEATEKISGAELAILKMTSSEEQLKQLLAFVFQHLEGNAATALARHLSKQMSRNLFESEKTTILRVIEFGDSHVVQNLVPLLGRLKVTKDKDVVDSITLRLRSKIPGALRKTLANLL